jgi:site-specific DNA-methyltransferase (adenine-specific)
MSRKNALAAIADKQKKQTTQLNPNLMIEITNEDNMELMKRYPDNYFDLAIVDPPYGIGEDKTKRPSRGRTKTKGYEPKNWDNSSPNVEYFEELKRVSKNQIIWGANHFISKIPFDSSCWLVWNKKTVGNTADCELAWTSFKTAVRRFDFLWEGFWQENMKNKEKRIHPTQKPSSLYAWIIQKYTEPNFKIIDTHIGSGSIAIAVDNANKIDKMNLTLVGCELDKDYYNATMKRIKEQTSWQSLF